MTPTRRAILAALTAAAILAPAMMGGLLIATLLTLIFLPALYATWYGVREPDVKAVTA